MITTLTYTCYIIAAYISVSSIVFILRHPWLTETQISLYIDRALFFSTVDKEYLPEPEYIFLVPIYVFLALFGIVFIAILKLN